MSKIKKVLDQEAHIKEAIAQLADEAAKKMESIRRHYEHEIAERNRKIAHRGELIKTEVDGKMKKIQSDLETDFQAKKDKLQKIDLTQLKKEKSMIKDVYISLT